MGKILDWPIFMSRRRRKDHPIDDVSAVFCECCSALNTLSPKTREMVAGWLGDRYRAQLEEDMLPPEDEHQAERDQEYVRRVSARER